MVWNRWKLASKASGAIRANETKVYKLCAPVVVMIIASCSSATMNDLEVYVSDVLSRQNQKIEPLPEFQLPETYVYQSRDKRSPFRPVSLVKQEEPEMVSSNNGVKPPCCHSREELEQFPLDALEMVGTLKQEDDVWGIILGPEGTVYRTQTGNYIGRNYGRIHTILEDRIELTEIVPDGQGGWEEQEAALALAE